MIAAEIPDFWLGVFVGSLAMLAAVVVLALAYGTRKK